MALLSVVEVPESPEHVMGVLDGLDLDVLCVPVFEDVRPLRGSAGAVDWRTRGQLSRILLSERFQGSSGSVLLTEIQRSGWARRMIWIGIGPWSCWGSATAAGYLASAGDVVGGLACAQAGVELPGWRPAAPGRSASVAGEGGRAPRAPDVSLSPLLDGRGHVTLLRCAPYRDIAMR